MAGHGQRKKPGTTRKKPNTTKAKSGNALITLVFAFPGAIILFTLSHQEGINPHDKWQAAVDHPGFTRSASSSSTYQAKQAVNPAKSLFRLHRHTGKYAAWAVLVCFDKFFNGLLLNLL